MIPICQVSYAGDIKSVFTKKNSRYLILWEAYLGDFNRSSKNKAKIKHAYKNISSKIKC